MSEPVKPTGRSVHVHGTNANPPCQGRCQGRKGIGNRNIKTPRPKTQTQDLSPKLGILPLTHYHVER